MGCGASDIEGGITIVLTKQTTDPLIYLAGEHVEGTIELDSAQYDPNILLKDAYIELNGQVVYTTTQTYINGNGTVGSHTTVHRVSFLSERQTFHSELTPENLMTISQFDKYGKTPFHFTLPVELPPSLPRIGGYHSTKPYVTYFICVTLELDKWYQSSIRYSTPIIVYPRIDIQNDLYRPIEIEYENRKQVHLHVVVSQSVILPGIPVSIHYNIHNPNRSTVNAITIKIYQHRHMGSRGSHKEVIFETDVPDVSDFKGEHLRNHFELTLPADYLPPTSNYTFGSDSGLKHCNPTSIAYELITEVQMNGLFTDFSLECPIIVGVAMNDRSLPPPSYADATKFP